MSDLLLFPASDNQTLALASIAPNLMIILTASFGFMRGKKSGMFVGFFCGLFMDVFSGNLIGFYALLYMVIGYLNGFFRRLFYAEDIKLPLILISGSEFVYVNLSSPVFTSKPI